MLLLHRHDLEGLAHPEQEEPSLAEPKLTEAQQICFAWIPRPVDSSSHGFVCTCMDCIGIAPSILLACVLLN